MVLRENIVWHKVSCGNSYYLWYQFHQLTNMPDDNMHYYKLVHWIMQFKSFHWHSHHGLWAMTPCSTNMIVLCNITLVLTELSWDDLFIFWGVFYKTITTHMLVGYEMIMANSALRGLLAIYHLISNVH